MYGADLLNLTASVAYLSSSEDLQAFGASNASLGMKPCPEKCVSVAALLLLLQRTASEVPHGSHLADTLPG